MKTQIQIAIEAEISPSALSNIINGYRRPSWPVAKKLAEKTKTKPELWLEGTTNQKRSAINKASKNG